MLGEGQLSAVRAVREKDALAPRRRIMGISVDEGFVSCAVAWGGYPRPASAVSSRHRGRLYLTTEVWIFTSVGTAESTAELSRR